MKNHAYNCSLRSSKHILRVLRLIITSKLNIIRKQISKSIRIENYEEFFRILYNTQTILTLSYL